MIGPTWGLIDKMALYVNVANNKITVICETDQVAQMASRYLNGAYLLKAARPPDSRPPATLQRTSLQRLFHWWGIRRTPSERENAGSP